MLRITTASSEFLLKMTLIYLSLISSYLKMALMHTNTSLYDPVRSKFEAALSITWPIWRGYSWSPCLFWAQTGSGSSYTPFRSTRWLSVCQCQCQSMEITLFTYTNSRYLHMKGPLPPPPFFSAISIFCHVVGQWMPNNMAEYGNGYRTVQESTWIWNVQYIDTSPVQK